MSAGGANVKVVDILDDEREIAAVRLSNGRMIAVDPTAEVRVDELSVYGERGQCGFVPWIAVITEGVVVERHDLMGGSLSYRQPEPLIHPVG